MAKSLRSKRKRKVRAEKRIVNAKKELVKLKEVAARLHGSTGGQQLTKESLEANVPDVQLSGVAPMSVDDESTMDDGSKMAKGGMKINNKWMNQRKIRAIKSKIKKHNTKKARRGRGGRNK